MCAQFMRAAESNAADPSQSPISYRRVFVPANNVVSWPRGGEKYIPVETHDFEAWAVAANRAVSDRASAISIDAAEYTARLESDGRLGGRGQWRISLRGEKPAFLPLSDMSLAIRDATWKNAAKQPVRLGYWGASESEPDLFGLEVVDSDTLTFQWTTAAQSSRDDLEVPWQLPTATSTRLILDLPESKQPHMDGGTVLESTPTAPDPTDGKPRRRWVLAVNPSRDSTLRISSTSQSAIRPADQLMLSEDDSYDIGQNGMRITAIWRIEGPLNQQRELTVPLPRGAQLESITADGNDVRWRVLRSAAPAADVAILALPNVGDRRSVQIVLSAWHSLVIDRSWQLPILRPDGVFWSSGKLDLSIAAPFELRSLTPVDCAQSAVSQLGADAPGPETHSLVLYSPAASVEVAIARREPDVAIRMGSSLVLADPEVTCRLSTEWNVTRSSVHRLSGDLAAGWNVETVETIPADAMAEWFIDRRGNRRRIEIQLTDAASRTRKITVFIMGRLQRFSLAAPISADTLRMVNWSGARVVQHLLTFQSTEPFAVDPIGDLRVLARNTATDADLNLLDANAHEMRIVDLAHAGDDAGLQLTFKRGQYAADINLEATLAKNELRQEFRITAQPKANPVDRVLVFSTAPLGDKVRWTEKQSDVSIVAERLPVDDPLHKNLPKDGELWLLRLPQPTAGEIDIRASVTIPWSKRASVPLLALPEAIEQQGHVVARGNSGGTIRIEPEGLSPIPLPMSTHDSDRPDESSLVRAAYRFMPTDCLDPTRTPRLWIGLGADRGTSLLVARYLDLESFYWPDGRGTHRATYELENYGAAEFRPALPPEARLTALSIDGRSLETAAPADGDPAAAIRLPQAKIVHVSIYFETRQTPLAAGREVYPPILQNDIPLLAGQWNVWLPEEYSAQVAHQPVDTEFNWRRRLFGPLARPHGSSTFHPFRPGDWARLLNGISNWRSTSSVDVPRSDLISQAQSNSTATTAAVVTTSEPTRFSPRDLASMTDVSAKQGAILVPLSGWHWYHASFVADGSPDPIVILHPSATTAWAVAIFLACLVLGRVLCRSYGMLMILALAVAASLALLLPAAFSPLATGAWWGFLFSTLGHWIQLSLSRSGAPSAWNRRGAVAGVVAVAVMFGLTKLTLAESPVPQPLAPNSTPIERVFIPVDENLQPLGTKLYVSERFLRELIATSANQIPAGGQWLLRGASYAGELTESRSQAEIAAGTWVLTYSIETLARDATVVLPLVRNEAIWQSTAMLDGVPVPLNWRESGLKCFIEIAQPGRYALTIYCVPKTENTDDGSQFKLTVPPILSAGVEVHAPELLTGISVAGAMLTPPAKDASGIHSGELALVNHLAVRWPHLESKTSTNQRLTVTALGWLHVGTTETLLETKYVVEGGARRPEMLTITYDGRWQPLKTDNSTIEQQSHNESAGPRSIQISLPADDIDRQEVSIHWKLTDAPLAGNVLLPPIELTSLPVSQRWFAVSADPSLECAAIDNTDPHATAKEFLAKWGSSAEDTPQIVLANADPNRALTLAVHPRETESVIREVMHVAAGSQALRVVYQASVTPGTQHRFQYRVAVPANLTVDEITLNAADRKISTRWTRDTENHVNIVFAEEVNTDFRLALSGRLPIASGEKTALPRVTSVSTASATQQVQLHRDDDVRVDLQGLPPAEESSAGPKDLPPVQWLVRPLGVYHLDDATANAARIIVEPSRPSVTGETLTTLTREGDTWWAAFRCRLVAEHGDVDILRLRIPSKWTGPFNIESKIPVVTDIVPLDEHTQTLAIRFASTIVAGGQIELQFRGPLELSSGSPAAVPDIGVISLSSGHRYVLVPQSLDSQLIAWNEVGVRQAEIPRTLIAAATNIAQQRQLEVVKEPFHVALRTERAREAAPRIRLADSAISAGNRGSQLIVTRLIVATDGLPECTLQLPADQELVSVTLDGRPALTHPVSATSWRTALGAPQLPQSIEIVSRSTNSDQDSRQSELRRPTLLAGGKPIPVELSLWSFAHSPRNGRIQIEGASSVSAVDQAALRLDRLLSIAEAATAAAAEAPRPDGHNWFKPWAALLTSVRGQTQLIMAQPPAAPAVAQVSRSSEEQINRASKRLDQWLEQSDDLTVEPDPPPLGKSSVPSYFMIATQPSVNGQESTFYVAEGGADRLVLNVVPTSTSPAEIQLLGLLIIIGLTAIGAWLFRSPVAADFLCRWAYAFGVLVGIAYWAWLWPSWLGLVFAAASLWFALRFNWPGRSLRPEASTVLRSTRTH
jgi:hypothetical protein